MGHARRTHYGGLNYVHNFPGNMTDNHHTTARINLEVSSPSSVLSSYRDSSDEYICRHSANSEVLTPL